MIAIKGTTITMTRGDTLNLKIPVEYDDGTPYIPAEGDKIRFAMKENYSDEECVLRKEIPTDSLILRIESEETKELPQPSSYVYDIQLTMADGTVDTFINKAKLILTEEVE